MTTTVIPHATSLSVTNPGTGEVLGEVEPATQDRAAEAVDAARQGKRAMSALAAHERAALLEEIAARMTHEHEELARLLAAENGKPIRQTREEVGAAIRIFRGFGEESKRIFGRQVPLDAVPGLERHLGFTMREPLGVVAAIVPFNYPVELYAHKAAAALAAGNAVIAKPPTKCPLTLLRIAALIEDAGAPAFAHQALVGGHDVVRLLAETDGVDMITFTGGTEAGVALAKLAAGTLKQVDLELGGNDAMIVCDDADVRRAAEAVVLGRLARGNGQICCAVKRVYVEEPVYEQFAAALALRAEELVVGNQLDEATDVGPLIDEEAAVHVEAAVHDIVTDGGRVLTGGKRRGAFFDPTVVVDVPPQSETMAEEIFGPVAPLLHVARAEQAVELANDSPYGLQASVFTRDIQRAFALARRLEVGGVVINGTSALRAENLPFGGVKLTGGTRESIHDTLLAMTRQKAVIVIDAFGEG